mmetsp:Transcript_39721/g.112581  ORF Transcript_39721/g.112581 Transcript_39721/m.112581 type:complete len:246 (-) Transcript_39721:1427-2164(-)
MYTPGKVCVWRLRFCLRASSLSSSPSDDDKSNASHGTPVSVLRALLNITLMPLKLWFWVKVNRFANVWEVVSYKHKCTEFLDAHSNNSPLLAYVMELKYWSKFTPSDTRPFSPLPGLMPFMCVAENWSFHPCPLRMSRKPSIVPTVTAVETFQNWICPAIHDTAHMSLPRGSKAAQATLEEHNNFSELPALLSLVYKSQTQRVLSHAPVTNCPGWADDGENCNVETKEVCPERTSKMLPVWRDHT